MNRSRPIRPPVDRPDLSTRDARAFSLWCPAPLQQIYRRARLSDDAYELVSRRTFIVTAIGWLPLFILTAIDGRVRTGVKVPFLFDLDLQARLLVALPLLIVGEVIAHRRMPATVRQFVDRRIVAGPARTGYDSAVSSALRLSRSALADVLILVAVCTIGVEVGASISSLSDSTWLGSSVNGSTTLTPAGWWYVAISRPLFQFVLLRWYYRFFVWNRFLWQVSRLRLHLMPTHPDHRGGLGFVFGLNDAFAAFLFAHGTMLAGRVANGVIHAGLTVRHYELELVTIPIGALLFVLGPEFTFALDLWRTKRQGLKDFGMLAQQYVREFDNKWVPGRTPPSEALLGSADIQSLADLANSFGIVEQMRILPRRETILNLGLFTVLPLIPLPLTVISGRELLERLVKVML
jgi:hypothetical protein